MRSFATTEKYVEILYFKHFFKHFTFDRDSNGELKKVQKTDINVSVGITVVCGDTKI